MGPRRPLLSDEALPVVALTVLALALAGCAGRPPASTGRVHDGATSPFPPLMAGSDDDADWPMFRDDPERTGFAEGTSIGRHAHVLWSVSGFNRTKYAAVKGSPAVVGGTLYCGSDTGRFVARDASDGSALWEVQIRGTTHGIHGSPAIVGDAAYVTAYDGGVYALDRKSGRTIWSFRRGYQVGSSPAVVPAWGILYSAHEMPDGKGYLVALDARTGTRLWEEPTEGHPHASVAVDVGRRRVFGADNHGYVYARDAWSGELAWESELARTATNVSRIKTTPMVIAERGLVVVGAWSGKVTALDEQDGHVAWEREIGGKLMGSTAYAPGLDLVYVGSPLGVFYALDARDGAVRWTYRAGARIMSSPAVTGDERAVVFAAGHDVHAVDAASGESLFDVVLDGVGELSGSPTVVGRRIYVTAKEGALVAIETDF